MEKSEYYDNGIDTRTGLPWGDETEDDITIPRRTSNEQTKDLKDMDGKKHLAEMTDEIDFIHGNKIYEPTKYND